MAERSVTEELLADYDAAFDALPLAAVRIRPDRDGRIDKANPAMARLLGAADPDELTQRRLREFCAEPRACDLLVDQLRCARHVLGHEIALQSTAGDRCVCAVTAVTHTGPNDHPVIDALFEPIERRRSAFNAQLETSAHLRQAQQLAGLATWTLDHARGELQWSRGVYELFGLDPDAVRPSYQAFLDAIHPDDRDAVERAYQTSLTRGEPYTITHRVRQPDGEVRFVAERCETEFGPDGAPLRSLGVVQDVTDAERTRRALEQETQRLEDVIRATGAGTWQWNVQTGETRFNPRWAEIVGYSLDELAPTSISTWTDLVHPDDLARSEAALRAHFEGHSDTYSCEARMRHRDGHWVWVLDRGRVVEWDAHGQPLWMYGTHHDITVERRADEARERRLEQLRKLTDQVPGAVYQYQQWPDGHNAFPFASNGIRDIYGVTPDEVRENAAVVFERLHPDDAEHVAESIRASYESLDIWHCEYRAVPDRGTVVWLEGVAQPEQMPDGSVLWHGYIRDVTERKKHERKLNEFASVFRYADEGILITDRDGTIIDVNAAFSAVTGYSRADAVGANPRILKSGRHPRSHYDAMFDALERDGKWTGETWNRHRDGHLFAVKQTVSTVYDKHGRPDRYIAMFSDITEIKRNQERLQRIADYDLLTGLPNRSLLASRLEEAMRAARASDSQLAVVYIDLDGFKEVNDTHGHATGDRLLKAVAERLESSMRRGDTLARMGGDEFVGVLRDIRDERAAMRPLSRLLKAAAQTVTIDGNDLSITTSVGVTWYPQALDVEADQLVRQADQAMYQAKQSGRNRYRMFDADHDRRVRDMNTLADEVRAGLERDEFELHYQPRVDMATGRLLGAEALIRWRHPDRGLLMPGDFLPDLEGQPVMRELGRWVVNAAAHRFESWLAGGHEIPVSVNIDGYTLLQPDFLDTLDDCFRRHPGLGAGHLELEVVETSALQDLERVRRIIRECAERGVDFAIDDFGTGYSSLTYLKRLPAGCLKIDATFVRDMLADPDDMAILDGVLGLARSFRRNAVAEGVETIEHGLMLLAFGCRIAQGYAIAAPMPGDRLPRWASKWQPSALWHDQQRAASEDRPALFAYVEHNAWLAHLRAFLVATESEPPPLDAGACRFGHWLAEHASCARGDGEPSVLERIHERLHNCAAAAVAARSPDERESARTALTGIEDLHAQLVAELERLLDVRLTPGG